MIDNRTAELWISEQQIAQAFYRGRKVLVLGGDGFIGLNITRALAQLQAETTVLSRRSTSRAKKYAKIIHGDFYDPQISELVLDGQSIIFDCIGATSAAQSNQNPETSLERECRPHLRFIQACVNRDERPLVMFLSSRLVYGRPIYLPVDEQHPLNPTSIYAAHKITVENYLRVFGNSHGLRYCIFRVSNPYGPYQPLELRGYGVINQFIQLATAGQPIRLFGDGRQIRDYVYVEDLVNTLLLAAMTKSCEGEIFNVGDSAHISIAEAATQIAHLAGDTPLEFVPWPEECKAIETGDYYTSCEKLDRILGKVPSISFDLGIKRTLAYYRKQAIAGLIR